MASLWSLWMLAALFSGGVRTVPAVDLDVVPQKLFTETASAWDFTRSGETPELVRWNPDPHGFRSLYELSIEADLGESFVAQWSAHYRHGFFDRNPLVSPVADLDDYNMEWDGFAFSFEVGWRF